MMMRRFRHVVSSLLLCLGLCSIWIFPASAADYMLDQVDLLEDSDKWEDQDVEVASGSDAIMLFSNYGTPYDGSIGTTYLSYFRGVVEKLSPRMHYVLFRPDQYNYRLVYASDLTYSSDRFSASDAYYVNYYVGSYNDRIMVTSGSEGSFSLSSNGYPVYSDVSELYPVLTEGGKGYEVRAILYALAFSVIFKIVLSWLTPGRFKI